MKKIIGLAYDVKEDWVPGPGEPPDANAEFDKPRTINEVVDALEKRGYVVKRIGGGEKVLSQIDNLGVDIVFNLTEGRHGRNRESQVPVLLEMKGIPFIGSDGLTLGITLDKVVAKKLFIAEGIPTPRYFEATATDALEELNHIGFPLMVKTRYEGSSKGISKDSRVHDYEGLRRQVELINTVYKQPALVEEFIRGTEFTVAVLGNDNPHALPVVQVKMDGDTNLGDKFYTFARISSPSLEYVCPAPISDALSKKIQEIAVRTYRCVGCRDFGRIDFRVDEKNNPSVLEVNPLPCLAQEDVFSFIATASGVSYEDMIEKIVTNALERYGLMNGKYRRDAAR